MAWSKQDAEHPGARPPPTLQTAMRSRDREGKVLLRAFVTTVQIQSFLIPVCIHKGRGTRRNTSAGESRD
jgi:hypothetical protein